MLKPIVLQAVDQQASFTPFGHLKKYKFNGADAAGSTSTSVQNEIEKQRLTSVEQNELGGGCLRYVGIPKTRSDRQLLDNKIASHTAQDSASMSCIRYPDDIFKSKPLFLKRNSSSVNSADFDDNKPTSKTSAIINESFVALPVSDELADRRDIVTDDVGPVFLSSGKGHKNKKHRKK